MRVVYNNTIKLKRAIEEIGGMSCTIIKIGESLPYDISNSIKIKIPRFSPSDIINCQISIMI